MNIAGLQKMTLLDFPGRVACTVFLGGCNFRCPYCHNSELLDGNCPSFMTDEELLTFLTKRRGLLDGVCITGGEPTLQPELPALLRAIKAMGYAVKLDTNGTRPALLRHVYRPLDPSALAQTLGLVDRLISCVGIWRLRCNTDIEAARVSFSAMSGGNFS